MDWTSNQLDIWNHLQLDGVKRIWYLSPMRAVKVQASLRICAVSPEPSLLAHTSSESRGTFRQKARSRAPLNGWACAVKICHDQARATEILKSKSVHSTDDVIDVIQTWVRQSQIVTKTLQFHPKVYQKLIIFSDTIQLQPVVSKRSRDNPKLLA